MRTIKIYTLTTMSKEDNYVPCVQLFKSKKEAIKEAKNIFDFYKDDYTEFTNSEDSYFMENGDNYFIIEVGTSNLNI